MAGLEKSKRVSFERAMIHHIALIVSGEGCLEFYKKLGFEERFRKERANDTVVLLSGHGAQLEVFIDPRHPKKAVPEPLGLRHFALTVDDIENTVKDLGCPIQTDWVGERFVFISDPDGNKVELHE